VGEDPIAAIVREAKEEIGVTLASDELHYLGEFERIAQNVVHSVHVFESRLALRPTVRIDNREIIRAEWHTRDAALDMDLAPQLRRYLEGRLSR
jgi:8-oxo-dGTP diphosphatase